MTTNHRGIDYGFGQTNIDNQTGIRYGVIPSHDVGQAWYDDAQAYYGKPHCPQCGNEACEYDDEKHGEYARYSRACGTDYACEHCEHWFGSGDAFGDEPISFYVDDGEYLAEQSRDDGDIFIVRAPYFTRAQFCSPCAPGACYLPNDCTDGERAYCFGHDWFDGGRAPYPVYRVTDDSLVEPNN